jgi:hypothetical protein
LILYPFFHTPYLIHDGFVKNPISALPSQKISPYFFNSRAYNLCEPIVEYCAPKTRGSHIIKHFLSTYSQQQSLSLLKNLILLKPRILIFSFFLFFRDFYKCIF